MKRSLEPLDALRLMIGGPVALLTTRWRERTDVMPAIWTTPLSRVPPLIGVAVHPSRHSHDMVRFAEEFAINFPGRNLVNHTHYFGSVAGQEVNKLELARLQTLKAKKISAPLIEGCLAHIECGLEDAFRIGDHTLFVGRVLVVDAEEEAFEETWRAGESDYRPLHYLGLDRYGLLGETFQASLKTTEEGAIQMEETVEERERRQEEEAQRQEDARREGREQA